MISDSSTKLPLDHVAVAVPSIDEHRVYYELVTGDRCSPVETIDSQGVRVAFVGAVELLEPIRPDSPVGRFLERRGPGLHHIAYRTEDILTEIARLRDAGMRLIDETPRPGAGGHQVAFLHPAAAGGVLIELVQRSDGD